MNKHWMYRNRLGYALVCGAALLAGSALPAPADGSLEATLAKMDEAAAHFKALSANVEYVTHMDAIHEDDQQTSTILVKRPHPKDLHVKISYSKPEPKVAVIDGNKVDVYYPGSGETDHLTLGHRRSLVDMLLLLGFGGTSRELQSAYSVTYGGPETIAGQATTRLVLVPKAADMLEQVKKIDLWISDRTGNTVQQKFYQPGRDYTLITYTEVKINPDIPDSAFKIEVPKGTKKENLNKK